MAVDNTKTSCKYYTYIAKSETNCFNVSWTFSSYSKLTIDKEYVISSIRPVPECHLELIFKKSSGDLFLYVKNKSNRELKFDLTTYIFDENRISLHASNKTIFFSVESKVDVLPKFSSTLYNNLNSLPKDTLTLNVEFRAEITVTWDTFEEPYLGPYKNETKFSEDLKKFILENHSEDVLLKTKDSQVKANKGILRARSTVFRKMFDHSMSEQENDTVSIEDVSGPALEILVDFLNTGKADLKKVEPSCLNDLYYAADKYEVLDLRKMCAAYIFHELTTENCLKVLKMSLKHSDEHLKKGCMVFIRRHIASIIKTGAWKDLKTSDPDVGNEIFEFCIKGDTVAE